MSLLRFFEMYTHRVSLFVNIKAYLYAIKVDSTARKTRCTQLLSEIIEDHQFIGILITWQYFCSASLLTFDNSLHLFVCIASVAIDDGMSYLVIFYASLIINMEYDRIS